MEKNLKSFEAENNIKKFKEILNLNINGNKRSGTKFIFSQEQWISFAELANDLELDDQGIKILYHEINSGNLLLPCDREKISH